MSLKALRRLGIVTGFGVLLLAAFAALAHPQASPKPLTKEQVLRLLKGDVPPKRVTQLARERGVAFAVDSVTETELRQAGADDDLLRVLRALALSSPAANPARPTPTTKSGAAQPRADPPLTQVQILGLVTGIESSEYLARLVRERGVDFQPAEDFLQELRGAGGQKVLEDALRSAKQFPRVASPEAPRVLQHLREALQFLSKGDPSNAETELRSAVALDPLDPVLHIDLGSVMKQEGKTDGAEGELRGSVGGTGHE